MNIEQIELTKRLALMAEISETGLPNLAELCASAAMEIERLQRELNAVKYKIPDRYSSAVNDLAWMFVETFNIKGDSALAAKLAKTANTKLAIVEVLKQYKAQQEVDIND